MSLYLYLYLSLFLYLYLSSVLFWHHMLSLRESLRVFLAGARSPCREVGSGTDKFNDDQRFTTGEHDLQPGGEFHGKDNAANAVTATKMQRS